MIRFISGYTSSIPLNYPRIAASNYAATATGTAGLTYDSDVLTNENTYEKWDPSGGGSVTLDLGSSQTVSYVAIAAHTLSGSTLTIERSTDDVSYTSIHSAVETNETPLIFVFTGVSARYIRITISGGTIGVVYCGQIIEMQRGIYSGHTPITNSRNTVKNLNRSIRGQFLGTSIVRTGLSSSYNFENIDIDWYKTNIDPLAEFARTKPIFVAWNPSEHPEDTAYGYVQDDIKPNLAGSINLCSFSFELDAYA